MSASPRTRGSTFGAFGRAIGLGAGVGIVVAALGQAAGLVLFLAQGANGPYAPYVRLGAVYVELFHHVPVAFRLSNPGGTPPSAKIGIALLLVTGLAVWLLARAGRRLPGTPAPDALLVVAAAASYAAVPFALAFVARGRVRLPDELSLGGALSVNVSAVVAFVTPFAIAAAAVAFGMVSVRFAGTAGDRIVADVVAGGLRSAGLIFVLSVVGVLVLASIEPALGRVYGAVIAAADSPKGRVVIAGHALLLLPDQALWVAVPAMGACDEIVLNGRATPFLCYWRRPTQAPVLPAEDAIATSGPGFRVPPRGYLAFLFVPLVATLLGGARAAKTAGSARGRAAAGAASGLVFAGTIAVAVALARIDLLVAGGFLGRSTFRLTIGPELVRGTALALAWGVAGGALGGLAARYRGGAGTISE